MFNKAKDSIDMSNLSKLMKERNYSVTKVALNAGVKDSTMYEYLKNNICPSLPVLINLADFFSCNLDYLIGRCDNPNLYEDEECDSIIYLLESLSNEERQLIFTLIRSIIREKEKI